MTALHIPRRSALIVITMLVAAATVTAFAESFRGLYLWAAGHGLSGTWAVLWPIQIDVFLAVGEAALFVALVDRWAARSRGAAWAVTLAGLAASVAGNVGHVAGHDLASRLTAAVPPLAAASALAVGLGVLKRVVGDHHAAAGTAQAVAREPQPAAGEATVPAASGPDRAALEPAVALPVPPAPRLATGVPAALAAYRASVAKGEPMSQRALAARFDISRRRASQVVATVKTESNGHQPVS